MNEPDLSILKLSNIVNISTAVIIRNEGKILLIQEKEIKNGAEQTVWNFPSGKVHYQENLFEAAKREVLEETGLTVTLTGLISIYYYTTKKNSYNRQRDRLTVRFNFAGEMESTAPILSPEEAIQTTWLDPQALTTLLEEKKMRNWIAERLAQEALTSEVQPLETVYVTRKR